jgi:hypothetical protein
MQINSALDAFNYPGPRTSTGEYPTGWDTSNGFVRTDHHFTDNQQLTLRYSVYDIQSDNARGLGGLNDTSRATRLDDRDLAWLPQGRPEFQAYIRDLLWAQKAGSYVYTAPAVWKSRVYVGTYDGRFRAFDAATGDPVWTWDAPGAIHGAPTVMAGLVYFATTSSGLATSKAKRKVKAGTRGIFALDARTGKLVWQQRGIGQYSPIVADSERVYMTGSTRVYGLQPESGQITIHETWSGLGSCLRFWHDFVGSQIRPVEWICEGCAAVNRRNVGSSVGETSSHACKCGRIERITAASLLTPNSLARVVEGS